MAGQKVDLRDLSKVGKSVGQKVATRVDPSADYWVAQTVGCLVVMSVAAMAAAMVPQKADNLVEKMVEKKVVQMAETSVAVMADQ